MKIDNEICSSVRSQAKRDILNLKAQVDNDCDDQGYYKLNDTESGLSSLQENGSLSLAPNNNEMAVSKSCSDNNDNRISQRRRFFDKHGFILVESFADTVSTNEVIDMKEQMENLVKDHWDPNNNKPNNSNKMKKLSVFSTDEKKQLEEQGSDDYFLESANNIHFFAEPSAIDDSNGGLRAEFENDKLAALNKTGHGMHMVAGVFHDYTTSKKVKELVKELGWVDPVVPQSMYIFKQARVGGEVTSHQDSTFLYTTPRQTCLGLWLALDDSTIENGCLWVRPGSHRESVRRRFARNPAYFGEAAIESRSNIAKGNLEKSKLIFVDENETIPWEGKIPGNDSCANNTMPWNSDILFDAGFIPIECKAGDLIAFPGQLDHLSLPNYSDSSRHTFQLHLVEGTDAGITWSKSNWLQYPKDVPFLSIR